MLYSHLVVEKPGRLNIAVAGVSMQESFSQRLLNVVSFRNFVDTAS
jgi:hypothetical protein